MGVKACIVRMPTTIRGGVQTKAATQYMTGFIMWVLLVNLPDDSRREVKGYVNLIRNLKNNHYY